MDERLPARSRRPRRDTRRLLIERGLSLAARHGFAAMSVRTLCAEVGIRESSFYAHFGGKSDLLRTLLEQAGAAPVALILRRTRQAFPAAGHFVPALADRLVAHWAEHDSRAMRLVLEQEASRSPEFRASLNTAVTAFIDELADVLDAFAASQQLHLPTTPRASAWALVAPLAALRTTYLALGASAEDLAMATTVARDHAAFWLATHRSTTAPVDTRPTSPMVARRKVRR